ncbi:MAG: PAS domain-containing protein, partial [Hyphomicrobiaceae bacterium]
MSTAEIEDQSVRPPIAARRTRRPGAFVLSAAIVVATGLGILAALTANAGAPLLLAVLGVLAALGVFLVFGIIAGHIRVSERTSDYDLLTSVFETVDHGLLVTAADGTVISANTAARDLLGTGDGTALPPLSLALGGEPRVDAALFRLHRAVGRGISRTEEVELPARQPLRPSQFVKLTAHPLGRSHIDADYDGAIVWTLMDVSRDRAKEAQVRSDLTAQLDFYAGLPAGLIVADDRGTLQFVSDRMRQWLGLDSSGSDLAFSELAASDTAELLRNLVAPTGQHDRVLDVDLVDQKGYLWPARVVAAPFDPVTRTTTLLILQRQASEVSELSAGDDRAAAMNLLRSAPFGIATLAYNGRILAANAAFSNLLMTSISPRGDLAVDALARKADAETQAAIAAAIDMSLEGRAGIAPVEIAIGTDGAFTRRLLFGALDGAGRGGRDGERPVAV